jgi:hypothetical protein
VLKSEKADEGTLADLALRRVFGERFEEIRCAQDLIEETYAIASDKTSPSDLREIALQARNQGKSGLAYYLEVVADHREEQAVSGRLF